MGKKIAASYSSQNLGHKLRIAFALMSVLPLLVTFYLVAEYILPRIGLKPDVLIFLSISVLIAFTGFFVIKEVFDRVVSVSSQVKLIAAGDIGRKVEVKLKDELGDLSEALNQITQRVRGSMEELQTYGRQTNEMNSQIQRRLLVLASVLQVTALISQKDRIDKILQLIVEKAKLLADSQLSYYFAKDPENGFYSLKKVDGSDLAGLFDVKIPPTHPLFKDMLDKDQPLIIDIERSPDASSRERLNALLRISNTVCSPVHLAGEVAGFIGIGNNRKDQAYSKDDIELLDVFAKQVSIAVGNEILLRRIEKLEIKDNLTGLYNRNFIMNHLREEIKRAMMFQRPCSFVLVGVDRFEELRSSLGPEKTDAVLKKIASVIRDSVREIDRVGRFEHNSFVVVLPEKSKREMQKLSEELKNSIESNFVSSLDNSRLLTVSVGTAENPLDGVTAEELLSCAQKTLQSV